MTNLVQTAFLLLCGLSLCLVEGRPTETLTKKEEIDSYAIIPSKQQEKSTDDEQQSELNLEMVPPSITLSSPPHIYYMNEDGIAKPAEYEQIPIFAKHLRRRRRNISHSVQQQDLGHPVSSDEDMDTAQTIIIRPPNRRSSPFGYSPFALHIRAGRPRYSSRWHKYPWNYHR